MAGGRGLLQRRRHCRHRFSKYATGYTVTADYAGGDQDYQRDRALYRVFGLAEAGGRDRYPTSLPRRGGGFDWRWLLVLPPGGGRCRPWYSGPLPAFKKYKSKKEWKRYNK